MGAVSFKLLVCLPHIYCSPMEKVFHQWTVQNLSATISCHGPTRFQGGRWRRFLGHPEVVVSGSMRILEMSTEYLMHCQGSITFVTMKIYHPRSKPRSPIHCCPSPVAESTLLERSDCECWEDGLVFSDEKKEGSTN